MDAASMDPTLSDFFRLVHDAIAKASNSVANISHGGVTCAHAEKEMVLSFCNLYMYVIDNPNLLREAFKSYRELREHIRSNLDLHERYFFSEGDYKPPLPSKDFEELNHACETLRSLATTVRRLYYKTRDRKKSDE